VLVIGGGIAGIQASLDLANAGCKAFLVEREPAIGRKMAALNKNLPTLDCSICIEAPKMSEIVNNPNVEIMTLAEVEGEAGSYNVAIHEKIGKPPDNCLPKSSRHPLTCSTASFVRSSPSTRPLNKSNNPNSKPRLWETVTRTASKREKSSVSANARARIMERT
jgi:heterodisulfide reductase subunit A-like polyferredoxin